MRSTHPFEFEEVMAYLDGEVAADRASEIAQHVQQCPECRALASNLRDLSRQLSSWEVELAPTRLTDNLKKEVAAAGAEIPKSKASAIEMSPFERFVGRLRLWPARPWIWAGAGALAVLALMVAGIPYLGSRPSLVASRENASYKGWLPQQSSTTHLAEEYAEKKRQMEAAQQAVESSRQASSLENEVTHYSVSFEPGATPAPPISPHEEASESPATLPMIARTASLSLVVKDFAQVESTVKSVTARHSGYIGELSTSTPPDSAKTFSATVRVPSGQLESTLSDLKQLGRMDQESQSGEEVTKQYVDLAARLNNARATEQRLLGVLRNNTGKVKDVLEVENEISRVRGEIEEMEADQRALKTRVDFATITLSIAEEYKASLNAAPASTGTRLHNAFVTGYHSLVESVIGLVAWVLESGPTLLLWIAILFLPVRWAWRRVRRAFTRTPKPAAA